ncbi:MAG: TenA family transcriptional regulator [Nitrososphaerales archaeon]
MKSADEIVEKKSLLKHPFYRMWSRGELTMDHLSGYSKEYFALVKAVPDIVSAIGSKAPTTQMKRVIAQNLTEEQSHIALWMKFASSLGISETELANFKVSRKTQSAVSKLKKLSLLSFEEAICSMYAYESALPKISRTKREGLKSFYGLDSKDATTYFDVHEEADVRHAAVWRKFMKSIPKERRERALRAVESSMRAQNKILDSVMDRYVN